MNYQHDHAFASATSEISLDEGRYGEAPEYRRTVKRQYRKSERQAAKLQLRRGYDWDEDASW